MIPIKELRVGSYWQLNTKTGQVLKIVTPCEIADASEYGIGVYLTNEVLEKCGFIREDKVSGSIDSNGFSVFTNGPITYNTNHGWWIYKRKADNGIVHLHILQNLFFSLTGTELTYTP